MCAHARGTDCSWYIAPNYSVLVEKCVLINRDLNCNRHLIPHGHWDEQEWTRLMSFLHGFDDHTRWLARASMTMTTMRKLRHTPASFVYIAIFVCMSMSTIWNRPKLPHYNRLVGQGNTYLRHVNNQGKLHVAEDTLEVSKWLQNVMFHHYRPPLGTAPIRLSLRSSKLSSLYMMAILTLSGDVELNPGPYTPKYPCMICAKAVKWKQKAIQCDNCEGWYILTTWTVAYTRP